MIAMNNSISRPLAGSDLIDAAIAQNGAGQVLVAALRALLAKPSAPKLRAETLPPYLQRDIGLAPGGRPKRGP